jgi:hypothetical protein
LAAATRSGSISTPTTRTRGATRRSRPNNSTAVQGAAPYPRSTATAEPARRKAPPCEATIHRSIRRNRFGLVVPRVTAPTGRAAREVVMRTRICGHRTGPSPAQRRAGDVPGGVRPQRRASAKSTAQTDSTARPRTDTPRCGPDPRRKSRRNAHPHHPQGPPQAPPKTTGNAPTPRTVERPPVMPRQN